MIHLETPATYRPEVTMNHSYFTALVIRVVGEVGDWVRLTPEQLQAWRDRLANSKGEILN